VRTAKNCAEKVKIPESGCGITTRSGGKKIRALESENLCSNLPTDLTTDTDVVTLFTDIVSIPEEVPQSSFYKNKTYFIMIFFPTF
jgi:hypothetical protein